MPLSKIRFEPGIHREGTQYSAGPSWYDCDKIRFRKGRPESVGGWVKYIESSFKGVARSLLDWGTSASNRFLGVGTNVKFYIEHGTAIDDVTPIRQVSAAGAVTFTAVLGETELVVADATIAGHGAVLNDYVTFTDAVSLGGDITAAVLNQEYRITGIVDDNSYTIESPVAAAAGDAGAGGGACFATYQINTGLNTYVESTGWGSGVWGGSVWGAGGEVTFANQLRLWSQDTDEDNLIINPRGGNIYIWQVDGVSRLALAGDVTFAANAGTPLVTITDVAHGAVANDYVTFSGAASLGGNIDAAKLNQQYRIVAALTADTYTIKAKDEITGAPVNATNPLAGGDDGDGGAAVAASYTSSRATPLSALASATNTPTLAHQIMVSHVDRHLIAFGCNDLALGQTDINPLLVRWANQEQVGVWGPLSGNTAGGQVLSSGSRIIGAIKTRQEILVFTDISIHSMRFSGAPFVFQFAVVSSSLSMIAPNAGISAGDAVFFMGTDGFYVYKGSVSRLPCTVLNYVFTNMDKSEIWKIFTLSNLNDSEVTWFYPANGTGVDVTNYVTYNYGENAWSIGTFDRGAWIPATTRGYPIASSNDVDNVLTNYLYTQEYGYDAEGEALNAWLESGEVSIEDGNQLAFLRKIIPDFKFRGTPANADITITIKGSKFPLETPVTRATKTVTSSTKQLHVRVRAREIILRMDENGKGYGWTMGDFRFGIRTSGRR